MSRKTALATRLVGPVVAAANGISGWAARARPASSSRAGSTESQSMACTFMPSARLSISTSKYSRPARRSSSIRRRTVDSCQWMAAASAALLARPSRASSASSGSSCRGQQEPAARARVWAGRGQPGELRQLGGGQRPADALPGPGAEVVQDRVRGDLHHPAAAGQAAQEQGVALLRAAGLQRADDLGPAGGEVDPPGVRTAGQGLGDRVGAARGGLQPDEPVDPAQPGSVEHAEHAQPRRLAQPAVTPGGGLVGDPGHVGDGAEGRPGLDRQDMEICRSTASSISTSTQISVVRVEIRRNYASDVDCHCSDRAA